MNDAPETSAMREVYLRLLRLTMNKDIGLTAAAYGFSSTAFHIGYVLLEVPSNLVMDKAGCPARIMLSRGIVSATTTAVVERSG